MRALVMLWLIALAPIRPDPTPKEDVKPPQELVLGEWHYTGDGKALHPGTGPHYVLRFTQTETHWVENGNVSAGNGFTAKVTFDWTKNPVTVDLMPKNGGGLIRGIIRLEPQRLILAWSHNENRPTDFVNAPHVHHFDRTRK